MKKLNNLKPLLIFGFMILILSACSSQKNTTASNKVSVGTVSGTWTVSDVRLEDFPASYKIKNVFNMAPYEDFIGSTWKLYGGFSGYITLNNGTTQNIHWTVVNNGITPSFQFKKLNNGEKAKDVSEGYFLDIDAASKTGLILKSAVKLSTGKTAYIVYYLVSAN